MNKERTGWKRLSKLYADSSDNEYLFFGLLQTYIKLKSNPACLSVGRKTLEELLKKEWQKGESSCHYKGGS